MSFRKSFLIKFINNAIYDLPAPVNLNAWWNFGSLLGIVLLIQIVTGLFLSFHYVPHTSFAFESVIHIIRDVNYGWLIRYIHANGARFFFIFIYIHIGRGIYYGSYINQQVWNIGIIMLFLSMATAFVGYVLPWGQISYWGATVITNLLSSIPYFGPSIVEWIWGGFSVDQATLNRFYSFHFILPFIILFFTILHLIYLHTTGSNNPLGLESDIYKIPFAPYYLVKDIFGFFVFLFFFCIIIFFYPNFFAEPENFIPANVLSTPAHIKPEWYFLWLYAILRSIPNKLGGVCLIFLALLILFAVPYLSYDRFYNKSFAHYNFLQSLFWFWIITIVLLSWVGAIPVEYPFIDLGFYLILAYFSFYPTVFVWFHMYNL